MSKENILILVLKDIQKSKRRKRLIILGIILIGAIYLIINFIKISNYWLSYLLIIFCSWCTWKLLKDPINVSDSEISNHRIVKQLMVWGKPKSIWMQICLEENNKNVFTCGLTKITKNWLTYGSNISYKQIIRLSEIVWVYPKKSTISVNFIPVETSLSLIIDTWRGQSIEIGYNNKNDEIIMLHLMKRIPYVFFGYDNELFKIWKENPETLGQMIYKKLGKIPS